MLLMLVCMTYNVGIFLSVMLGYAVGEAVWLNPQVVKRDSGGRGGGPVPQEALAGIGVGGESCCGE